MAMRLRRPWQPAQPNQEVSSASGRGRVDHDILWSGREGLSDKDPFLSSKHLLSLFYSEIFAGFWWGDMVRVLV
jgi:hypothetical protein